MNKFPLTRKEVQAILDEEVDLTEPHLYDKLYEYYYREMPYGIAKARDGDPVQWIYDRLAEEFGIV